MTKTQFSSSFCMVRQFFNILRRPSDFQIEAVSAPQDTCDYLMAAGAQIAACRGTIPDLGEAPLITKPADPTTVINALNRRTKRPFLPRCDKSAGS